MTKKKKPRKKRRALTAATTAQEESWIASVIQELKTADFSELVSRIPDAHHGRILLERLPLDDASLVPFMMRICETFQEKSVKKALSRALFKLKQKGMAVEEPAKEQASLAPILKPPEQEQPTAFVGPVDGLGFRTVLLTLRRSMKGLEMGIGLVSEEHGIQQFLFGSFSKKRMREIKDQLSQDAGPLVDISLAHAATILERAYKKHLEMDLEVPTHYLELRPKLLEKTSLLDRHPVYDALAESFPREQTLSDSQIDRLFQHDLLKNWFVDLEKLQPFVEEIQQVDDSPILLTDAQKEDRVAEIKDKAVGELYPEIARIGLKHRLEEMAYYFWKQQEPDVARLALRSAQSLDQGPSPFKKNSVLMFLLERSMTLYSNDLEEAEDEGGEVREEEPAGGLILP